MSLVFLGLVMMSVVSCAPSGWPQLDPSQPDAPPSLNLESILEMKPEDGPFFKVIADEQDALLQTCETSEACYTAHFLRGLASIYEDPALARHHFQDVVVAKPDSRLADQSRFWLWLLESRSFGQPSLLSHTMAKRLVRELIGRELTAYDFARKLEKDSIKTLERALAARDKKVEALTQKIRALTQQDEQLKKEVALRQSLQKELKVSENKVQELTNQLEALRQIDLELKEKAPPTRPSEQMAPPPDSGGTGRR